MSLLLSDPKKLASIIFEDPDGRFKRKPETPDGAVKDHTHEESEQGRRLIEALSSKDPETVVNSLRSFVKSVLDESTDESPNPDTTSAEL